MDFYFAPFSHMYKTWYYFFPSLSEWKKIKTVRQRRGLYMMKKSNRFFSRTNLKELHNASTNTDPCHSMVCKLNAIAFPCLKYYIQLIITGMVDNVRHNAILWNNVWQCCAQYGIFRFWMELDKQHEKWMQ